MAFGFGFNKQKVLSAAEKFVQQGKLQNAIAEYEKILKNDPKDLTVTNTVGDLYARLGENASAVQCFKSVGDAYAGQGFTVKAIAMYKKIAKLSPSVDGSLKLAELYTQQGLFNDARAQYLQVAEDFMKNGDLDQAVRLFQKVLEMDPENAPMRVKLAEVYVRLGKKQDAWQLFSAAAETLRARGSLAAAEDILQRMLTLDPGNSYVLLLRGRAALESDDPKKAIGFFEKAADLDSHPDGLRDLMKSYLRVGRMSDAAPIAEKLLTVHNDPESLFTLAEGYSQAGQYAAALETYRQHADRLLATDSAKLLANLHAIIGHLRDDAPALDHLLELLNKAGESTHVGEVTELLAHASVQSGNLERARDLYQMLATMEPQNSLHMQNYEQVVARMADGGASRTITAEEGAVIVDELEATAPVIDQTYPDDVALAIRSALTDADLFLSYNLPDKAMVPLLGALPQAPHDVRLNQRLAALHTRAHRFTEAAVCCRNLETAYSEAGFPEEATRYGDLAARYEHRAEAPVVAPPAPARAASAASAPPMQARAAAAAAAAPAMPQAPEFSIEADVPAAHESEDLSAEWDQSLTVDSSSAEAEVAEVHAKSQVHASEDTGENPEIAEIVEEARFYLEHYMPEQARSALARLESLTSDPKILDPLRAAIEGGAKEPPRAEPEVAKAESEEPQEFQIDVEMPAEEPSHAVEEISAHAEPAAQPAHAAESSDDLASIVADLEASLGDSFPQADAPEPLPAWPQTAPTPQPAASKPSRPQPIPTPKPEIQQPAIAASAPASSVAAAAPALSYSPTPVRPLGAGAEAIMPSAGVDLSEMFGELKHELEEENIPGKDDDPETHYNLGVAFREMGLLDEAIAELQKVCSSVERGHPFTQLVQTYTWLAQCFLDKNVPEAAVRWYEKALTVPGLNPESRVAIHYELGSACETAQDKKAALKHFTEVYGANIDYRDVAERIQALKS